MCKCANINNLVTASTAKGNFLKHHSNNEKTGSYLHPLELSSPSPKSSSPNNFKNPINPKGTEADTKILLPLISIVFLVCMGKKHEYYYNTDDFYTSIATARRGLWNLPIYHPFHVTILACFFSGIVLVPVLYGIIYR